MEVSHNMGKIITVTGPSGSGKTTFAVNLACSLAQRQQVVIIVECNYENGGIQVFFGANIPNNLGIFVAVNDRSEQYDKYLVQCRNVHENIYLLGVPNDMAEVYLGGFMDAPVETMLRKLMLKCDYLIIDTKADIHNGLSIMGMVKADSIYYIIKPTIEAGMFYKAHIGIYKQLSDVEFKVVVSKHDEGVQTDEFLSVIETGCEAELEDVPEAAFFENLGEPICMQKRAGKSAEKYKVQLDRIAENLISEG